MTETNTENTPGTRERILQAAIAEFAGKGFSGARTDAIARNAQSNIRMIYHYFGNKEALYVEVLEHVLDSLRSDELRLDFEEGSPVDGMRAIFDFIHGHFAAHPELMSLLSWENLNQARYLQHSSHIPERASPVIALLDRLLREGEAQGQFRAGVDPLHLYVAMVSMAYFHKSNAYTLSHIFRRDLLDAEWQRQHKEQAQQMLFSFLAPQA
ncbi:TetR family transcriptional regulator [Oxalobacteraceae bacterium A2-2]